MGIRNALLRLADRALGGVQTVPVACCVQPNNSEFFWGMRNLPLKEATQHLGILGTTGSGKTTLIKLYLQSIAHRFRPDALRAEQLIIYDAQCDMLPLLASLGLNHTQENFWILNPIDYRCARWKLGEAMQQAGYSEHFAHLLVPVERHSTAPFFSDAARNLVRAVIDGLNATHGPTWSFRDLLCALDSKDHVLAIASHTDRGGRIAKNIIMDDKHSDGVFSSLTTKVQKFDQTAALWHSAPSGKEFGIDSFLAKPGVLVLGFDPVLQESIWPTNAMLLKSLAERLLQNPTTDQPNQWFVFDEFSSMKNVSCVVDLLSRGRAKGASVLLGNLNIPSLFDVYGENQANTILSLLTYKCFLRAGDPTTAQWIENYISRIRYTELSYSENEKGEVTTSYSTQERSPLMASFFLNLPLPAPGREFHLVSDLPSWGGIHVTYSNAEDIFSMVIPPMSSMQAVSRRSDPREQHLQAWSQAEEIFFCGRDMVQEAPESVSGHLAVPGIFTEASECLDQEVSPLPEVKPPSPPKKLPAAFRKFHQYND